MHSCYRFCSIRSRSKTLFYASNRGRRHFVIRGLPRFKPQNAHFAPDTRCQPFRPLIAPPSLNKRPRQCADDGIAQARQPGLGPVQVGVGRLAADQAEGVEGVVRGPFALERFHRPVPDEAVRMLGADGLQLPLEILLAYLEGRLELDVVR